MALEFRRHPPELLRNGVQIFFCPSSFARRKSLKGLQNNFFQSSIFDEISLKVSLIGCTFQMLYDEEIVYRPEIIGNFQRFSRGQ